MLYVVCCQDRRIYELTKPTNLRSFYYLSLLVASDQFVIPSVVEGSLQINQNGQTVTHLPKTKTNLSKNMLISFQFPISTLPVIAWDKPKT